ncbi:MAG: hypothetical protein WAL45_11405 [Terracidiphilus sp.]
MKILRSVLRRGYTVGTAGFFTITSPNRWFAASRLHEDFPFTADHTKETAAPSADELKFPNYVEGKPAEVPADFLQEIKPDRHTMRLALIFLGAAAVALTLLWWFFKIAILHGGYYITASGA